MADELRSVRVRITGLVQGVSFRVWAQRTARRLGVVGWVRNEADGSVAALVVGPPPQVEEMLRALGAGPPASRVAAVDVQEVKLDQAPRDFEIVG